MDAFIFNVALFLDIDDLYSLYLNKYYVTKLDEPYFWKSKYEQEFHIDKCEWLIRVGLTTHKKKYFQGVFGKKYDEFHVSRHGYEYEYKTDTKGLKFNIIEPTLECDNLFWKLKFKQDFDSFIPKECLYFVSKDTCVTKKIYEFAQACPCVNKKYKFNAKQIRADDEAATLSVRCNHCCMQKVIV